uniref:Uncharacterized protein n=1 Tax=Eutreptiella gymnastica TaxID=73025 RepID=A0A7S4FT72_9EUGL
MQTLSHSQNQWPTSRPKVQKPLIWLQHFSFSIGAGCDRQTSTDTVTPPFMHICCACLRYMPCNGDIPGAWAPGTCHRALQQFSTLSLGLAVLNLKPLPALRLQMEWAPREWKAAAVSPGKDILAPSTELQSHPSPIVPPLAQN